MIPEIARTIQIEVGNDPKNPTGYVVDSGGKTRYGISQKAFPNVDIDNLTLEGAAQIYTDNFWTPLRLNEILPTEIRWKIFDIAVNCGTSTAGMIVQQAVGVQADGIIGAGTIGAINASKEEQKVFWRMVHLQVIHYDQIVEHRNSALASLEGWTNRAFQRYDPLTA